jgi:hypothetical protein
MAGKKDQPGDQGQAEVQARMDEAHAKGYEGYAPDPTPNAAYTVAGRDGGRPTPETDADAKAEAAEGRQGG